MPPSWLSACACGPAGLASAQGRCTRGLAWPARSVAMAARSPCRCQQRGAAQRAQRGRGWDEELILGVGSSGILPATTDGDGDLRGGRTQRRWSVPVEEPPSARWHKPHHTVGVAWGLLTEEERRRFELLSSMVENKGVSVQRSPGKIGEGGGMSVGVDGQRKVMTGEDDAACSSTGNGGGGSSN
jgi:hypothetical protein